MLKRAHDCRSTSNCTNRHGKQEPQPPVTTSAGTPRGAPLVEGALNSPPASSNSYTGTPFSPSRAPRPEPSSQTLPNMPKREGIIRLAWSPPANVALEWKSRTLPAVTKMQNLKRFKMLAKAALSSSTDIRRNPLATSQETR